MELIIVQNGRDREIIDRCRVCKVPFFEGESRQRIETHVINCVKANHDRLMAKRKERNDFLKPWDPELAAYVQDPARAKQILDGDLPMPKG